MNWLGKIFETAKKAAVGIFRLKKVVKTDVKEQEPKEETEDYRICQFKDISLVKDGNKYLIRADGKDYSLFQFARLSGIKFPTLYGRVQKGWDISAIIKKARKTRRDYKKNPTIKAKLWKWKGEKHSISEWAKIYGVKNSIMRIRLINYGSPERNTDKLDAYKANRAVKYTWNGESHTIKEWAQKYGCSERAMTVRLRKHHSPEPRPHYVFHPPSKLWEWGGEKHTAAEWAKIVGKGISIVRKNLRKNGNPYSVIKRREVPTSSVIGQERTYTWNGITKKTSEWAQEYHCTPNAIRKRFKATGSPEEPKRKKPKELYWCDGENKTLEAWAQEFGLTPKQVRRNFEIYGSPTKPRYDAADEVAYESGLDEQAIDEMLHEEDEKNKGSQKQENIRDIVNKILEEPDDGTPLREILGIKKNNA